MGRCAPSQATRQGQPSSTTASISLNAETIELTLSDAIYLGLRDNRAIRSAYLDRIAQKFDLRVAEDRFTPKLVLSGGYLSSRNQDDRYRGKHRNPHNHIADALWHPRKPGLDVPPYAGRPGRAVTQ